ncbi:MAG: nucleotidyltransferase domain-containing protein [Cytophagaceae bacterium]|nr:nucleotidyltransferase domain-containing protein [Gemmatimonadaceae bacterium]
MPDAHRQFLLRALDTLADEPRIVGVAAGGSYASDTMDEFSDLDLVLATTVRDHAGVLEDAQGIAASLGPLVAAFTGEHVREPRLLICLYDGPPPIHVDLKFVALPDLRERVEDPVILWEREGRLTQALQEGRASYPQPNGQWIEDRFWVWVHYAATKLGRAELFEVLDFLSFLRGVALGPLMLARARQRPSGVRRQDLVPPTLRDTVASYDAQDAARALRASIAEYRSLRDGPALITHRADAERVAVAYLDDVATRLP